jgi:hypothetical protein
MTTPRVHHPKAWLVLSTLPLLALAIDFALFPRLAENQVLRSAVPAMELVASENTPIRLGSVHSAEISVVSERLSDSGALSYLAKRTPSGLAISIFVDIGQSDQNRVFEGELMRAVRSRLQSLSPDSHRRLTELMAGAAQRLPGDVLELDLNLDEQQRSQFPVDRLVVVVLEKTPSEKSAGILTSSLKRMLAAAKNAGLEALAVPCLGYRWNDKTSLTFEQVFKSIFEAVEGSSYPTDLFISFYSEWPTAVMQEAVGSFNHVWAASLSDSFGLYRDRYRTLMPLLALCLFSCRKQVKHTIKSFLLISGAYLGTALGLAETLDFFTEDYPGRIVELVRICIWLVLALGAPYLLRWDFKEVFRKKRTAQ